MCSNVDDFMERNNFQFKMLFNYGPIYLYSLSLILTIVLGNIFFQDTTYINQNLKKKN